MECEEKEVNGINLDFGNWTNGSGVQKLKRTANGWNWGGSEVNILALITQAFVVLFSHAYRL